ncbi:hypothetical protein [Brevibacillus laterosporus]
MDDQVVIGVAGVKLLKKGTVIDKAYVTIESKSKQLSVALLTVI